MNKINLKRAEIECLMGGDLGKAIEDFARGEVEIAGMQVVQMADKKIAYIDYEDRADVKARVEASGIEFENYMKRDYYHAIEISVPITKNLAEKINALMNENTDIETVATYYFNGINTKNAIIFYASRNEFEKHEEEQKISNEAKAKARAEELAKQAVKDPDVESLNEVDNILDKYADITNNDTKTVDTKVTETNDKKTKNNKRGK